MKKQIIFNFSFVALFAVLSIPQEAQTQSLRYAFTQQFNDMCMISPMLNLRLLESARNKDGSYDFENMQYFTRREWFVLNHPHVRAWFSKINDINTFSYPHLTWYFENGIEKGPVYPHYYDSQC